jgi:hypothetical protein
MVLLHMLAGEDGEVVPPSPATRAAGGNMLPVCITRLTKLQELRLAGDWRRPKVLLFAACV